MSDPQDTMLDLIRDALAATVQTDGRIYYGTAAQLPNGVPWNYTVFSREPAKVDRNGYTDAYAVAVVREDYVPEGMMDTVVEALEGIDGIRMAEEQVEFEYATKPNTNRTVEMMVVHVKRARKRGR